MVYRRARLRPGAVLCGAVLAGAGGCTPLNKPIAANDGGGDVINVGASGGQTGGGGGAGGRTPDPGMSAAPAALSVDPLVKDFGLVTTSTSVDASVDVSNK